jgi:hypothetical protein
MCLHFYPRILRDGVVIAVLPGGRHVFLHRSEGFPN